LKSKTFLNIFNCIFIESFQNLELQSFKYLKSYIFGFARKIKFTQRPLQIFFEKKKSYLEINRRQQYYSISMENNPI
jgi:hypothetical protein